MSFVRTSKEIARHLLHRVGRKRNLPYLKGNRQERFAGIYDQGIWKHDDDGVPLSGQGSSLAATTVLRAELANLLDRIGTNTLLDLGCGDFTWMQHIDLKCDYVGLDVVSSIIEWNRINFSSPNRRFIVADFVAQVPPSADTVFCREVLFHLSLADAVAGLKNAVVNGCSHMLLTSDPSTAFNADIESGDYRMLNLTKPPFRLPAPTMKIQDSAVTNGRFIGLWPAAVVRSALG